MSTMIDVYRHFLGGMPSTSDADIQARLSVAALRYKSVQLGGEADTFFKSAPAAFKAYETDDVRGFAEALGVPWPVPVPVTIKSLAAELDALNAKFKAFAGG